MAARKRKPVPRPVHRIPRLLDPSNTGLTGSAAFDARLHVRTRPWLYQFCGTGELKFRKLGRTRLFSKRDIFDFLARHKENKEGSK